VFGKVRTSPPTNKYGTGRSPYATCPKMTGVDYNEVLKLYLDSSSDESDNGDILDDDFMMAVAHEDGDLKMDISVKTVFDTEEFLKDYSAVPSADSSGDDDDDDDDDDEVGFDNIKLDIIDRSSTRTSSNSLPGLFSANGGDSDDDSVGYLRLMSVNLNRTHPTPFEVSSENESLYRGCLTPVNFIL
jgi:hypothetical protein